MNASGDDKASVDGACTRPSQILVVDDEATIRTLLAGALTSEGYEVTTADCGRAAVALLQQESFDLIVTDIVMPGLNGKDVLTTAKRIDPHYPVIMITAYPSVETAVRLVKLGAADYITKPLDVDRIKITVAKILEMEKSRTVDHQAESAEPVAAVDGVTQVYNYALFYRLLQHEVKWSGWQGRVCSLLMAEIDNFDYYAPEAITFTIEELLKTFALTLIYETRPGDIIGRTDRAEFAVILRETSRDDARDIAQSIRYKAAWKFTISVGVASFPEDASGTETLLKATRDAKNTAKVV